jgi:hypothetical protein
LKIPRLCRKEATHVTKAAPTNNITIDSNPNESVRNTSETPATVADSPIAAATKPMSVATGVKMSRGCIQGSESDPMSSSLLNSLPQNPSLLDVDFEVAAEAAIRK